MTGCRLAVSVYTVVKYFTFERMESPFSVTQLISFFFYIQVEKFNLDGTQRVIQVKVESLQKTKHN